MNKEKFKEKLKLEAKSQKDLLKCLPHSSHVVPWCVDWSKVNKEVLKDIKA